MANRDVTIDILAHDRTARATRSAARNFDRLKRNVEKSTDVVATSLGPNLAKKLAPIGALLTKPLVLGIIAGAPAMAAALVSAASLGVGAAFLAVGAIALRENKKLQATFKKTTDTIKTTLAKAAAPLVGPFNKALKDIGKLVKGLGPDFKSIFKSLKPVVPLMTKAFSGVVRQVVSALKDSMPAVNAAFRGLASALPTVGKWIGEFIRSLLKNPAIIENTTKALTLMAAGPLKLLGPLLSGLTVIFGAQVNIMRLFKLTGDALWSSLVRWFDGGSGAIGRLKAAWGPLWTAIQNVWNKLKEFAAAKTDLEIEKKFIALVESIKKLWGPLKNFIGTVWAETWAFIKRIWNEQVVPWWNGTAKPWLKKAFSGAMDEAVKMMKVKAKAELAKLPGAIIGALAGLPGKIAGALVGGMAKAGASIGAALVNAIIGAINSRKGGITGVASSVGRAAAAAAKAAAANLSGNNSWQPAQFASTNFAFAGSGFSRTGGPTKVESTVNVSLDGAPFRAYTATAISESERRQAFRAKVGRR